MFARVLVANRGEIAVRVIRALHELDVEAVAVYSTADAGALHTRLADRAVCIGPPSASESYLNHSSVVAAAEITGCDAVHPGYGFLAENPEFVKACEENDLVFVGTSCRDPGVVRRRRRRAHARRAGMLDSAQAPEADRGVAVASTRRLDARDDGVGSCARVPCDFVPQCGHVRVPARSGRCVLLH